MGRVCIISDSPRFAELWASRLTVAEIAIIYDTSSNVVSASAQRYGLAPRRRFRGAAQGKARVKAQAVKQRKVARSRKELDPEVARLSDLTAARESGAITTPPFWSFERDRRVIVSGGNYADLAMLAFEMDVDCSVVAARWHLLRSLVR